MNSKIVLINGFECLAVQNDKEFYNVVFNGINLTLSLDLTKFAAQELMNQLCNRRKKDNDKACTKTTSDWLKQRQAQLLQKLHPEWFVKIKKKWFLSLNLLHTFSYSCDSIKGILWLTNDKSWKDIDDIGFVYLVQPEEYLNSNIYKVGRAFNLKSRFVEYGNLRVLKTQRVMNQFKSESILLEVFSNKFEVKKGNEYFICFNDKLALESFNEAINQCYDQNLIDDDDIVENVSE